MELVNAVGVTRYVAGPGCGKTYTLLQQVRIEVEEYGTCLRDLAFMTFARSQAEDVKNRIGDIFPTAGAEEIGTAVTTLHAAALRACRAAGVLDSNARIIVEGSRKDRHYFEDFARLHHLPYDWARSRKVAPDDDSLIGRKEDPPGNALFKIARYIRGQYVWSWQDVDRAMTATGTHIPSTFGDRSALLEAWAEYKAERGLFEHDDYVHLAVSAGVPAPASVEAIDEFQDLSPLQFVLSEMWRQSGDVDRIYVAGDPNQAIYGFRGAERTFLEKIPGPVEDIGATGDTAPVSRRCPAAIVRAADLVLGGRSNMTPRVPGGMVEVLSPYNEAEFAAIVEQLHRNWGRVMVLARYQREARRLSRALTTAGLPHSAINPGRTTPWQMARTRSGEMVDPLEVLSALDAIAIYERTGYPWTIACDLVRHVVAATRPRTAPESIREFLAPQSDVSIADVTGWFGLAPRPGAARVIAASALDFPEVFARGLLAAFDRPHRPDRSTIEVDTIHSAKGREAPAVVLHTGYHRGRVRDFWQNPTIAAEERRVYYTGCTRASEALVFLDGLRSGPSAPPLQAIPGVRP